MPIALLVCNDQRGREVHEACQGAEISIPYEIAVIWIDNDEILCDGRNCAILINICAILSCFLPMENI